MLSRRTSHTYYRIAISGSLLLFFCLNARYLLSFKQHSTKIDFESTSTYLTCRDLPGANDTLVIMRTGSTELQDKLPVHISTTFRCYPNLMIFSDYEEDFEGHHIFDALESVDPHLKETHPDFSLWRRLQQHGRATLQPYELSGTTILVDPGTGKADNPGW